MKPDKNAYFLDVDYWYYARVAKYIANVEQSLPDCVDFYFSICVGDEENKIPNPYRIHFLRYVPELLSVAGYRQAKKMHSDWFCLPPDEDPEMTVPKVDFINFSELIETSPTFKECYQKSRDTIVYQLSKYRNNNIKKLLESQVLRMIENNQIEEDGTFGMTITELVTTEEQVLPVFDTYHFHEVSLSDHLVYGIHDDVDGLLCTASMLRVIALGKMNKKGMNTEITIDQLGFYLKDQYAFDSESEDTALSYCEIIDKEKVIFSKKPVIEKESFKITPASYCNYRKDHEQGGNFTWYSSIHFEEVSIEFVV